MITYSDEHEKIALSGTEAIRNTLFGDDAKKISSMLLCLDYYLDPYYQQELPHKDSVFTLLEELAISSDNPEHVKAALHLLSLYCHRRLLVLENGFTHMMEEMKPYAKFVMECT